MSLPFLTQRSQYQPLPQSSPSSSPSPLRTAPPSFRRRGCTLPRRPYLLLIPVALIIALASLSRLHPYTASVVDDHLGHLKEWWEADSLDGDEWGAAAGSGVAWLPAGWEQEHGAAKESAECEGWDPETAEENDPEGCLKARQYRQTRRVFEREKRGEHPHWGFTRDHNLEALSNITRCFLPVAHPDFTPCHEKPLVIAGWAYTSYVLRGDTSGEVIWQTSLLDQLQILGYSIIIVGPYLNWIEVAEMMPDVYRLLWNSDGETLSCIVDPRCIAKEHYVYPDGTADLSEGVPDEERGTVPLWALNVVSYWGSMPRRVSGSEKWWGIKHDHDWSSHPLGNQWVATPWPLPGHVHLPYSIEDHCLKLPATPHDERKDAALVFAKRSSYFHYLWFSPMSFWTDLSKKIQLIFTATEEEGKPLPEGIASLGKQTREDYVKLVGSVKAMVGMGAPHISPSVYTALCQGTPVVMPYFKNYDPNSTDPWHIYGHKYAQHGPALQLGEPYVYAYSAHNYTQLEEVVRRAMVTPIEQYIPPDMRLPYALDQLRAYMSRDLKGMMDEVVRKHKGWIPAMYEGGWEACVEVGMCQELLPAGRRPASAVGVRVEEVEGV
ncbi:hypothetical protein IAT38_000092 [Cryptococcus sp. DSM 104549]